MRTPCKTSCSVNGSTTASGTTSTETWWQKAEERQDARDRRDRERRRAEILPLMLAAESMRMKGKRAAWRQRDASISELFPHGTYAARG
jgi:hypothetical protein